MRLALAAATITALVGIVAHVLLTEAPAVPPAIPHSGASSDAPLSSLPGAVQAAVDGNVEYATVTVGNTTHSGRLPIATTLRPGDNAITFSAPPFAALTCDIELPQIAVRGDCTLQSAQGPVDPRTPASSQGGPTVTVMFGVGASALDPAALKQATAAVSNALSTVKPAATVPSGEYYATGLDAGGNIVSARARPPLQAHVWLAPKAARSVK